MDSPDDCFSDDYFSDDSFDDPFCSLLDTDPFSTPSGSDPSPSPADSPAASFHSATEHPHHPETNPFQETPFNLVNYSFAYLNPNHHALPSGSDALSGHFDPDATQLVVSHTTFDDPQGEEHEPTWHPIATDGSMASASASASMSGGTDDGWDRLSAFAAASSGRASSSEWEQWEVRDVTPRESLPLQRLDPRKSSLYRRRVLERGYGVGERGVEGVGEAEGGAVSGKGKVDVVVDGQPRQGEEGRGGVGSRMRHGPIFVGGFPVWGTCLKVTRLADHICLCSRGFGSVDWAPTHRYLTTETCEPRTVRHPSGVATTTMVTVTAKTNDVDRWHSTENWW
ncbi:predicted protein [Chaetomium globosum CBS 148.51]|uniref:Uncharacterized protein n=1 Tax=Chaetomium globosum (strain ATCC 6205 / CBS 148.51 / DSM 1962 / NBRC 6347 / NRRL 1970) TaxID=306901 RepID=Q2H7L3_CHAGB|nr:uncharacterized protein CHGG_05352 [Chaetomium globosum CBS 148.51]EAQ88733.1 predicted protein [Chaetomium globosum CBS 148.51]